jgi:hypothetical protein
MLQQKHNVLRKVNEHHHKISMEAKMEDSGQGGSTGGQRSRKTLGSPMSDRSRSKSSSRSRCNARRRCRTSRLRRKRERRG